MSGLFSHILAYCGMFWRPPNKNPIESITSKISQKCNFGVCCTRIALSQNKDIKIKIFGKFFQVLRKKLWRSLQQRNVLFPKSLVFIYPACCWDTLFLHIFFLLSRARCQCVTKIDFSVDREKNLAHTHIYLSLYVSMCLLFIEK